MPATSDHASRRGARVLALALPHVPTVRYSFLTAVGFESLPGWASTMKLPAKRANRRDYTPRHGAYSPCW
jgi:hypothetical protein